MAVFKLETKDNISIAKKPRVYFTCHPDDFEKHFKKVCQDIFKTHDCAIYYTEDMAQEITQEEKKTDLARINLFVVPVTYKLLSTPNRAMDADVPYALKEHIPVLPIMMEQGIDGLYSAPDKFGQLQYLNPYSRDLTEISYEEKLKKYLDSVLISDALAKRVRAAFDAYIFLSYRKKDRKYANELMRLIHSNPECRDIAIWFDEFLTPGESFQENIEKILDDCKLFALLVTPRLLEKVVDEKGQEQDNYVVAKELPLARKNKAEKGIDIFAVEMEETDKDALSALSIEGFVKAEDEAFRTRLLESISRIALTGDSSPEHDFLIGLAYFDGIDVEVDRKRGLKLIEKAGIAGVPEAIEMMHKVYSIGSGVEINYQQVTLWAQRLISHRAFRYGVQHPKTIEAYEQLAQDYRSAGRYADAAGLGKNAHALNCKVYGEDHPNALKTLSFLASMEGLQGNYAEAIRLGEQAYQGFCKACGEEHPHTITVLSDLSVFYNYLKDYKKALELNEKVYALRCKLLGQKHPETISTLMNLTVDHQGLGNYAEAMAYGEKCYALFCEVFGHDHPDTVAALENQAVIYLLMGEHIKALELEEQVYTVRCKLLGENHPVLCNTLNNLMICYRAKGEYEKSAEVGEKAYALRCKLLGEKHPDTCKSLDNLVRTYDAWGKYEKAAELAYVLYDQYADQYGLTHSKTANAALAYTSAKKKLRKEKIRNFFKKT